MTALRKFVAMLLCGWTGVAFAQSADVVAQVEVKDGRSHASAGKHHANAESPGVVVWLNPVDAEQAVTARPERFRLVQRDKAFHPHLLVVPLGSMVEFPNLDPFFHNVFSQFNGKRFDLGLYEAGSTKTVRFDHEGVSYVFCNIHPEMSAVVIALATPYVAVASGSGGVAIHDVPAGMYEMHVWAEGVDAQQLNALTRRVRVGGQQTNAGVIAVTREETANAHKNKFGEDYRPDVGAVY